MIRGANYQFVTSYLSIFAFLQMNLRRTIPSSTRLLFVIFLSLAGDHVCKAMFTRNLRVSNITVGNSTIPMLLSGAAVGSASAFAAGVDAQHSPGGSTSRAGTSRAAPYSVTFVSWETVSSFCPKASVTVTIRCGGGVLTGLWDDSDTFGGVSGCYNVGNAMKCVSPGGYGLVSVFCPSGYAVSASVPKLTFSGCRRANARNGVFQTLILANRCDSFGLLVSDYSFRCAGKIEYQDDGVPVCFTSTGSCTTGGTSSTCKATTPAVSIASTKRCILYKYYGI